MTLILSILLMGCEKTPPDSRAVVTAPIYTEGDAQQGEALYAEYCQQCHKLQLGNNKKGPQLLGVYAAPASALSDYKYSEAMVQSNIVWTADALDRYIADPIIVLPETKMLSDPIDDAQIRKDIIAYLSTLGRESQDIQETQHELSQ